MILHFRFQLIGNRVNCDYLFLQNANYVIIERGCKYNIMCRSWNIGGFIDDNRGISGPCGYDALSGLHRRTNHSTSAGYDQQPYTAVLHQLARRLNGRLPDCGDYIRRPSLRNDCPVNQINRMGTYTSALRVRIKNCRISSGNKRDCITDDSLNGICDGCDRPDYSEGSPFNKCQTIISRKHFRAQIFCSGSLFNYQ